MRQSGTVKFFNTTKGFGFITPDEGSKDVFVHVSALERSGIPYLQDGQKVTFESNATQQSARGKLQWVSAEVDVKTRTVKARARIDNPNGNGNGGSLRPATFGKSQIHIETHAAAITVPENAVQWDGRAHRVFIRRDGKTFEIQA